MKILFDINHPAHFLLFKNLIAQMIHKGYSVLITTRDKDVLKVLIENAGLPYYCLSKPAEHLFGFAVELVSRNLKMFRLCRKFKPDIFIGSSTSITHIGTLLQKPSVVFSEDDDPVVPIFSYLTYPFASYIINPTCIKYTKWKNKRILHQSYHELAYLHPDNFVPDKSVLNKYNLEDKGYIIARFSALKAHHDVGKTGLSMKVWDEVRSRLHNYKIVKSIENETSHQIDPWDMHHIIFFAKMMISDSQTMTAEAAVLGVPAIRYNSFAGRISYLEELEHRYQLTYGFKPGQEHKMLRKVEELLNKEDLEKKWQKKRAAMLKDKIDLSKWMIDLICHS